MEISLIIMIRMIPLSVTIITWVNLWTNQKNGMITFAWVAITTMTITMETIIGSFLTYTEL